MATVAEALGIILDRLEAGRLGEAEEIAARVLAVAPDEPEVLHVSGVVAARVGRIADAFRHLNAAARRRPDRADIVGRFAVVAEAIGRPRVDAARVLICLDPADPAPLRTAARLRDDPLPRLGRWITLDPEAVRPRRLLFVALFERGRRAEAVERGRVVLSLDPANVSIGLDLAGATADRDPKNARRWALRGVAVRPDDAGAWNLLGVALGDLGREGDATRSLRRAAALDPARVDVITNLAQSLNVGGAPAPAYRTAIRATRSRPGHVPALVVAARAALAAGRAERAIDIVRLILTLDPTPPSVSWSDLLLTSQNGLKPEESREAHRRWGLVHGRAAFRVPPAAPRSDGRMRIGYISADFREHSVASFFEPLSATHDRRVVSVTLYSATRRADETTARLLASADLRRDVSALDDDEVADLVRRDGIDVLVDLSGHTADNRLGVLVRRPARIQASMLGYPGTLGSDAIDFRLSDPLIEPEGAERWSVEPIVRLKNGFLRWAPAVPAPDPSTTRPDGPPVFASFNALGKTTEAVMETWARVLRDVPDSRLMLKSRGLADPETVDDTRRRFAALGVSADRLDLVDWVPSRAAHMALYDRVDLALDPFPYNGTTTTCEALWMGVPVIALRGEGPAARVGTALLTRVGRSEWIAKDLNDYARLAVETIRRTDRSDRPRSRETMRTGPLGDVRGLARELEAVFDAALRGMR